MTRLDVIAGVRREECTAYRLVARRAGRVRHLGEVSESGVRQAVTTWQAAMRGWSVTAEPETFRRWVTGDDEMSGRGGTDGAAAGPNSQPSAPSERNPL